MKEAASEAALRYGAGSGAHWVSIADFDCDGKPVVATANYGDGTISIIDSGTLTVIDTVTVGLAPWQVIITEDGTLAFVSSSVSGTVSVIDTATREVIKTLVTGDGSFFSAINPDGTKFYVSNSNETTVSVIDIPSLTVLRTIPDVGDYPFDLAFGP